MQNTALVDPSQSTRWRTSARISAQEMEERAKTERPIFRSTEKSSFGHSPPPPPSGGSVDTTKTRSGPQRVQMCNGERPIGAAKGKQSDPEALCQPPPPNTTTRWRRTFPHRWLGGFWGRHQPRLVLVARPRARLVLSNCCRGGGGATKAGLVFPRARACSPWIGGSGVKRVGSKKLREVGRLLGCP